MKKNVSNQTRTKEMPIKPLLYIITKLGWKRLPGWARNYFVNPTVGKTYSVVKTSGKLRELNQNRKPGSNGYISVKLKGLDGKYYTKSEHKLIADAYLPNPENKPLIHHKNHDRTDNRLSNLERTDYKDNSRRRKDNDICKNR